MIKKIFLLLIVCCSIRVAHAQDSLRVVFYNVENLFDCKHDSLKNDQEFLPEALRRWTPYRYKHKLTQLTKVLAATGSNALPDIIGLCEVENENCMNDLTRRTALREANYRYIMTQSPDPRGIDVAFLYLPGRFLPLGHQSIRMEQDKVGHRGTRDILHVYGKVLTGDTIDFFVVHTPSRAGGSITHKYRMYANQKLRQTVDSIFKVRRNPYICIMGDFNDTPRSASIVQGLKAGSPRTPIEREKLYNLMAHQKKSSYRYKAHWELLDQFMISGMFLDKSSPIQTSEEKAKVQDLTFLLEEDDRYGGFRPLRTFHGMKYKAGYSDHLPVTLDLIFHTPLK